MICRYLVAGLVVLGSSMAFAQNVVHYTTTNANVKYVFATAEPVLHLKAGEILDTNTLDCFGNGLKKPGDTLSMAKGDNPLAGPFYVEGAEPGDTLAVKILDLQVDGDTGIGAFAPGFGAINETNYTPMLHDAVAGESLVLSHRPRGEHGDVQGARFGFLGEDSGASVLWMYWRGPGERRSTEFRCSGGVWREHGLSRGERRQHRLLSGEREGRAALPGRWARGDGRWRDRRDRD